MNLNEFPDVFETENGYFVARSITVPEGDVLFIPPDAVIHFSDNAIINTTIYLEGNTTVVNAHFINSNIIREVENG